MAVPVGFWLQPVDPNVQSPSWTKMGGFGPEPTPAFALSTIWCCSCSDDDSIRKTLPARGSGRILLPWRQLWHLKE